MSIRLRQIVFGCIAVFAGLDAATTLAQNAPRPNIILMYADDHRWDAVGAVQREQGAEARFPWLKTPALDQIAAEGVRFRNAFVVNSLCSPARACVLSGRYSHVNGIINNFTPLPLDTPTFARALQKAGYTTAYFGKYHLGRQRERPGFDEFASFIGQGQYSNCPINVNGTITPSTGWVDDVSTDYALDFLKRQTADKPFMIWLGFKSPHVPRGGENLPERLRKLFEGEKTLPPVNARSLPIYTARAENPAPTDNDSRPRVPVDTPRFVDYMRHIAGIDENVGRMLAALDKSGMRENTVVLYMSDNGFYLGEHGQGDKRTAYDESLRVPMLVRWPGHLKPGINDDLVLNIDWAPTFMELAGAAPDPDMQGRSLKPFLDNKRPEAWRTSWFYEYFKENGYTHPTVLATRTADAKLVLYPDHEEWKELFDLQADPHEMKNLYDDPAAADLKARMLAEHEKLKTEVRYRTPDGIDAPDPNAAPNRGGERGPRAGRGARGGRGNPANRGD